MDGIEEWSRAQRRVIALVGDLAPERAQVRVPACPDWTVRDLLSHMVGLGADVVAGDEPDDHNAEWTARQVARRRDRDVGALVEEWRSVAGPLRDWMAAHGTRPLFDVTIHEQDLRGALGEPGAQDTPAMAAVRDRYVARLADRLRGRPPLALVGDSWRWDARRRAGGRPPGAGLRADPGAAGPPVREPAAALDGPRRRRAVPRRVHRPRPAARPGPVRVRPDPSESAAD